MQGLYARAICKGLDRELYARAPKEGLPTVKIGVKVSPYALLRVLEGAYRLTDAPRLWYLRAREKLQAIGFVELKCARAVFRFLNKASKLVTTFTLHVDDCLLFADRSDSCYAPKGSGTNKRDFQHQEVE